MRFVGLVNSVFTLFRATEVADSLSPVCFSAEGQGHSPGLRGKRRRRGVFIGLLKHSRRHSINSASACSSVRAPASINTRLALGAASFRRVDCQLEFAGAAGLREPIGKLRGFVVSRGRRKWPGNHRLFDSVGRRRQLFSPRGLDCYGRFQCEHRSARGDSQYSVLRQRPV